MRAHIHVARDRSLAKFWLRPVRLASASFTGAGTDPRAADVEVTDVELKVHLTDGRTITAPLSWFPRLLEATTEERAEWQLLGEGHGIHWSTIDEDLSVAGLVQGQGAPGAR